MKLFAAGAFLALASAAWAEPISCPQSTIANTFGSSAFGSTASVCGNVSADSGIATISAPEGAVLAPALQAWLGTSLDIPNFVATFGSALRFDSFQANAGDTVSFDWSATFDEFTSGMVFAVLDGNLKVLDSQLELIPVGFNSLGGTEIMSIASSGAHSLAVGAVTLEFGFCPSSPLSCIASLDPAINASNFNVNTAATPEPSSAILAAFGLAGIVVGLRRRKNA